MFRCDTYNNTLDGSSTPAQNWGTFPQPRSFTAPYFTPFCTMSCRCSWTTRTAWRSTSPAPRWTTARSSAGASTVSASSSGPASSPSCPQVCSHPEWTKSTEKQLSFILFFQQMYCYNIVWRGYRHDLCVGLARRLYWIIFQMLSLQLLVNTGDWSIDSKWVATGTLTEGQWTSGLSVNEDATIYFAVRFYQTCQDLWNKIIDNIRELVGKVCSLTPDCVQGSLTRLRTAAWRARATARSASPASPATTAGWSRCSCCSCCPPTPPPASPARWPPARTASSTLDMDRRAGRRWRAPVSRSSLLRTSQVAPSSRLSCSPGMRRETARAQK